MSSKSVSQRYQGVKILPIEKIPLGEFNPEDNDIWTGFAEERANAEIEAERRKREDEEAEDDEE